MDPGHLQSYTNGRLTENVFKLKSAKPTLTLTSTLPSLTLNLTLPLTLTLKH